MEPGRQRNSDQFQPKWRHFHPQATLFMRNPFDQDIVFQVADEHNQPYQYRLPAGKVCELPGGSVATLGLKEVVDRLIGNSKDDAIRIWEPSVRAKYEEQVIVKVKEAPRQQSQQGPSGPVDLTASEDEVEADRVTTDEPAKAAETAFPGAGRKSEPKPAKKPAAGSPDDDRSRLAATAAASAGTKDTVIEED